MRSAALILLLLSSLAIGSPAEGQDDDEARSFWGHAMVGWGTFGCEPCVKREGGWGGGLAAGWSPAAWARVGVAFTLFKAPFEREGSGCLYPVGCGSSTSSGTEGIVTLGPVARFYPSRKGLFLLTGAGLGFLSVDDPDTLFDFGVDTGFGGTVGLGWDLGPRTGRVAATPILEYAWVSAGGQRADLVRLGVGLTLR